MIVQEADVLVGAIFGIVLLFIGFAVGYVWRWHEDGRP